MLSFADDIIAPTSDAVGKLLCDCCAEDFCKQTQIIKSKCILLFPRGTAAALPKLSFASMVTLLLGSAINHTWVIC